MKEKDSRIIDWIGCIILGLMASLVLCYLSCKQSPDDYDHIVSLSSEVDKHTGEHAVAVGLCKATEDKTTLEEWTRAACEYLDTQELVLGYVVVENSIHIRFASVEAPAVVCFPCGGVVK